MTVAGRFTDLSGLTSWQLVAHAVWPPSLLALITWLASDVSYLFGHSLAELFSVVVAMTALLVATTSKHFTRNDFVVYVAVAIGWCAALDLLHTLVFKGMNVLPSDSANPATQFWIAARSMQALALVTAPWLLRRSVWVGWIHLGFGGWSLLCMLLILTGQFPAAYIDGQGLTTFKIVTEYIIIGLLGLALLQFWRERVLMSAHLFASMSMAALAMMVSEFAFTQYVSVYAPSNLVGHLLKIYAYWFVYVALVQSTLRDPFAMLARAASTYDAVPDPTLIVDEHGLIRQANLAAAKHVNCPKEQLVGKDSHDLFHDSHVPAVECPVCCRLSQRTEVFMLELDLPEHRAVECSLAPFEQTINASTWVQVVRDISERRQLAREREILLSNLGERVKELSCLYAVSELMKQPDVSVPELLTAVVQRLPSAFVLPAHVQAAVTCDWGHFGAAGTRITPRCSLNANFELHGSQVGVLQVWYPDDVTPDGGHFLPEEQALVENVAQMISEKLDRKHATERVQRLSYFYELLSATNHAVIRSRNRDELLQALFDALKANDTFSMFFIALAENGQMPLRLHMYHGFPPERVPQLLQILGDEHGTWGGIYAQLDDTGKVVLHDVLPVVQQTASPKNNSFEDWYNYLLHRDISQCAVLPLICEGQIQGVVSLYAMGSSVFDQEQLRLLNEMADDMSFAMNTLQSRAQKLVAEHELKMMATRFEEVFQFSPVPMQIHSLETHQVRAMNRAHAHWLGYTLPEITDEDDWFAKAYPDVELRTRLRASWQDSVDVASQGQLVTSPELEIQCKDGSVRIARGTMTVVGHDAIVAWTDLTEIRHNERALRDSEQRFRSMVEQSISAIYVYRGGHYIYVNPRYCELIGWPVEALLGQEVARFCTQEPGNLEDLQSAWDELQQGRAAQISCNVMMRRKDGAVIELGLTVQLITWDDDQPAGIVMAQDVTERARNEARIAAYVKQLEASMRGTMQAVSNMVEMRDPYTAGHERRVGLIASALAQEMGWSHERCQNLELLGLVHDIGKIAVPSEILTKPTRLSRLEMELMRGHAQAGYDILKDVPFATPVAEIIRQHHERMNGTGYPQGLKGEQILPEARVLAVADVLESISSHRPYRPALGIEAGLAEIENHRGELYDPAVVDAAVRLIQQKSYVLPD